MNITEIVERARERNLKTHNDQISSTTFISKLESDGLKDNSTSSQGEGPLVTSGITSEGKRIKCDFVLWKGSKPGELVWKSPSGLGPHIECIVDANILLCENSFSQ